MASLTVKLNDTEVRQALRDYVEKHFAEKKLKPKDVKITTRTDTVEVVNAEVLLEPQYSYSQYER